MSTIIKPKRSTTAGNVPTVTSLQDGEFCINVADEIIYQRTGNIITAINGCKPPYLSYVALFLSNDQSTTIIHNDLGLIEFNRVSVGSYEVTSDSKFTSDKTIVFTTVMSDGNDYTTEILLLHSNLFYISTLAEGDASDAVDFFIEIRVYP